MVFPRPPPIVDNFSGSGVVLCLASHNDNVVIVRLIIMWMMWCASI